MLKIIAVSALVKELYLFLEITWGPYDHTHSAQWKLLSLKTDPKILPSTPRFQDSVLEPTGLKASVLAMSY